MNDNMEFRRARREEAEEILQLYRSLIGTEYCVWTENYPTEREVEFDLSRNALFCLYEKMLSYPPFTPSVSSNIPSAPV